MKQKHYRSRKIVLEEESWLKQYWRPMMAWQYFVVCLCDFIVFPLIAFHFAKETGHEWKWDPMTLKESGFYHIAMGVIIGVAAWTRGQENLLRTRLYGMQDSSSSQYPVEEDDEYEDENVPSDEDLDPPAHPTVRRRRS